MLQIKSVLFSMMVLSLFLCGRNANADVLRDVLESRSQALMLKARDESGSDSRAVYRTFAFSVLQELDASGDSQRASRLREALNKNQVNAKTVGDLSALTHVFAREFYKNTIIEKTAELMKFRTFATDVPNRQNPEFIRQRDYLRDLSAELGLHFRDVDGYLQEITLGEGERSLGVTVHSDVQPVDASAWTVDPWGGEIKDGALWGRGTIDDKGPLAVILYGMRALIDSGLPIRRKIVVMVGTDEESANEDMAYYLQYNSSPDQTIVVDLAYPVYCAEKGWCGSWLRLPRRQKQPAGNGLLIVELNSGFSPSIVPGKATATLALQGLEESETLAQLRDLAEKFHKDRPGSHIEIDEEQDRLIVTAHGKSVHSSVPETGHNALMDLLVFLDRYVEPLTNEFSLMARFAADNIGFDLTGESLGIAHHDDFMGDVSVAADMFQTEKDSVLFMFNYRIPRGLTFEKIDRELGSRYRLFERAHDVTFSEFRYTDEPLYNDPNLPFVQRLLAIYNGISGENLNARSTGGGTYAKRIPNAVVFGPNLPGDEYLGHQPDEHIKLATLVKNIEVLTNTLANFALQE